MHADWVSHDGEVAEGTPCIPQLSARVANVMFVQKTLRWIGEALIFRVIGLAALFIIWTIAASRMLPIQLPGPLLVWEAMRDNLTRAPSLELQGLTGGYLSNTVYTVTHALAAFMVGAVIGFVVGVLSARMQLVRDASAPFVTLFGTVPALVAAPFVLIWFGTGPSGQAGVVAFYAFVIVAIASQNSALQVSPAFEEFGATLGADSRTRFLTIVVPASIPGVIGAARIALASSWSLQAAVELLGSQQGVGRLVVLSQSQGFTAGTIAAILLLGGAGLVFDGLVVGVLRLITRWQEAIR